MTRFRLALSILVGTVFLLSLFLGIRLFGSQDTFSGFWRRTLVDPLAGLGYIQLRDGGQGGSQKHRVVGFLPYWTMREATASSQLTDIGYFSVALNADGKLREQVNGEREQGLVKLQSDDFYTWQEKAESQQQRMHIVITMMEADTISAFLSNERSQAQAMETITQVLASYPFSGVIIDIEYAGTVTDPLRTQYAKFIRDLDSHLAQVDPNIELSACVFGSAASKYTIWDVEQFIDSLDTIVVMSYDYHVRSSPVVGPVAPIFGKGTGRWQDDVVTNMRDLLKVAPARKILLGIPFYGYEWTATSEELGANTFPKSGSTATYKRVQSILQDAKLSAQEKWDEDALSPYVVYEQDGQTQFIYYENSRSLSYKLDFVEQLDFAGVAIWALGYEGAYPELWDVIGAKFASNRTSNE